MDWVGGSLGLVRKRVLIRRDAFSGSQQHDKEKVRSLRVSVRLPALFNQWLPFPFFQSYGHIIGIHHHVSSRCTG